jgi:hypothetical protein
MGGESASSPEVFTLVPRDDRPDRPLPVPAELPGLLGRRRLPLDRNPLPALPRGLVFCRWPDGRVTADGFPDAADVCPAVVARLDPSVVRLERDRLSITAANGAAVYVPVGPSSGPGRARYGRLYLRQADA